MEEVKIYKLPVTIDLMKSAWKDYKKNWRKLVPISVLVVILGYLFNFLDFYFVQNLIPVATYIIQAIFWIISSFLMTLGAVVFIRVLSGKKESIEKIIKKDFSLIALLFLMKIAMNFIIAGSFIPLVIPGIILVIAFSFFSFIVILERKNWIEGLLRSSDMTKGFRWEIFGRYFMFFLWMLLFSLPFFILSDFFSAMFGVPEIRTIAPIIITSLTFPFSIGFTLKMYDEFSKIKPKNQFKPSQKGKNWYTFFLIWGVVLFLIVAVGRFTYPNKKIFDENFLREKFNIEFSEPIDNIKSI
ncbi:MAG: hypothetical protein WC242_04105 [Candidatus Paceibacterota bacterium]|jgi:hypothetical protein